MKTLLGHAVYVEMVPDLRVSVYTLTVRLGYALGKDAWVFGVKQQVNSEKLHEFGRAIPVTRVLLTLFVVAVDQHRSPITDTVFVDV